MTELTADAFRTLAPGDAVPNDFVVPYYLDDRKLRISVARVDDRLYAFDDLCTCADRGVPALRRPAHRARRSCANATGPASTSPPAPSSAAPRPRPCRSMRSRRSKTASRFEPDARRSNVHDPPSPHDDRDPRAIHRRAHRLRPGPLGAFQNSADDYLKVHSHRPPRPTSPRARAASGSACTTTGRTPTTSSSRPPTPIPGAATSATPTPSSRLPDGTTDMDYVMVRDGKNVKGRFLGFVLGTVGKGRPRRGVRQRIKAIEARNNGVAAA